MKANPKYSMELKTEEGYFSSSNSFHYIGSTKSHVFFYDSVKKKVKVIPERSIITSETQKLREGI